MAFTQIFTFTFSGLGRGSVALSLHVSGLVNTPVLYKDGHEMSKLKTEMLLLFETFKVHLVLIAVAQLFFTFITC